MIKRTLGLCAALQLVAGCAGMSEQACVTADWRTIGFEDGTLGRSPAMIGTYRQQCAEHGVAPDLDGYRAGHSEGVQIYCRASNGFAAGHSGAMYQSVCPADLEGDFLAEYEAGRHLYELESVLRSVESRIAGGYRSQESIRDELTSIGATIIASETTVEERLRLVNRSAELGRRYGEITVEIQQLERERAVHERALFDYRQTLAARL